MKKHICYVCGHEIKNDPLYILQGKYRHRSKCAPLSANWLLSPVSKQTPIGRQLRKFLLTSKV